MRQFRIPGGLGVDPILRLGRKVRTLLSVKIAGSRAASLRITPAQSLLLGFVVLIVAGALLLSLPLASRQGSFQPFVDALFTAASAVTTTGLTVVDTGSYYSLFGQIIILILVQVGGLGYMAFFAFITLLVGRKLTPAAGITLQESLAGLSGAQLREFVVAVFLYTLFFEAIGTVALTAYWMQSFPVARAFYLAVFHSVSAFCTAGFSLFPDSFIAHRHSSLVNLTIAVVTLAGATGFFVLRELSHSVTEVGERLWLRRLSVHTKLALAVSLALIVAGSGLLMISEPGSLMGAASSDRLKTATFQALSASTTTGFNSVDIGSMSATGLFGIIVLMFVGGSPGGTAGGIKTTTLGAVLLAASCILRGNKDTTVFGRRLPEDTVRRALAIGVLAASIVVFDTLLLTATEKHLFLPLLFEVVAALGTVGLSTGITPDLSTAGRITIIITMMIGRLGPLAVGFALFGRPKSVPFRYAQGRVFIG
jgi:trk system potassium uptake protein TrkH